MGLGCSCRRRVLSTSTRMRCCCYIAESKTASEATNTGVTIKRIRCSTELAIFTYKELFLATNNFEEKLGEGGFGEVYKGVLQPSASREHGWLVPTPIAVKCLSVNSEQGLKEFEAEVEMFSRLRHKNLVQLLGWCFEGNDAGNNRRIMLVYEFVAKKSLDYLLYQNRNPQKCRWSRRFRIVTEVADALVYLQNSCAQDISILHRDIKPSNIMLDERYHPKLGDFGLSRKLEKGTPYYQTAAVNAPIFGTRGYIAPELLSDAKFSMETDIYSFGVVLLEVASGRSPLDCIDIRNPPRRYRDSSQPLIESVWDIHRRGTLLEAADKRLHGMFNESQMMRVLTAGLACCHPDPQARLTIKQVVGVLAGTEGLPCVPKAMPPPPPPPDSMENVQNDHVTPSRVSGSTTSDFSSVYASAPSL